MSQKDRVLEMLRQAGTRGVHSFEFYEARLPRAAARILELRAEGHKIAAVRELFRGESNGVRYRLVENAPACFVPVEEDGPDEQLFRLPSTPHYRSDVAA
jgi:hypothetical protein